MRVTRHHSCRVSPFGHPRINARLTAPRGISQPPTSFIGSQCQGIHHAPLNTYNTKNHYREKLHHNKHTPPAHPKRENQEPCGLMLATTIHKSNTTPHHQDGATPSNPTNGGRPHKPGSQHLRSPHRAKRSRACCLRTQQCVCGRPSPADTESDGPINFCSSCTRTGTHYRQAQPTNPRIIEIRAHAGRTSSLWCSLERR